MDNGKDVDFSNRMEEETFVSPSGLSSTVDNFEWDLLVGRGTGGVEAQTKWERESLYRKFDPLISARMNRVQSTSSPSSSTDGNRINKRKKQADLDELEPLLPDSEITVIGGTEAKSPVNNEQETTSPASAKMNAQEAASVSRTSIQSLDELQIRRLKEALEVQANQFKNQLMEKSSRLKDLEVKIAEASQILEQEHQQQSKQRVSVTAMEGKIDQARNDILRSDNDRVKITEEREQTIQDLRQAELAFSDLHSKYERIKLLLVNFKKNEEILTERHDTMKLKLERRDAKLKCFQDTVEGVFGKMKSDFESSIKSEDLEINRIRAQLRKLELRMATVDTDLKQKEKENGQLSHLCDDLIKNQATK